MLLKFKLYLFFILLSSLLFGQNYSFENYTTEEGLSSSQVLCVMQDSADHSLWLGTNNGGLNIFDGIHFDVLTKHNGMPDNTIFDVKDYGGKKYISTNGGLAVYDGKRFKNFQIKDGLKHDRVYCTFRDHKGNFWVATHGGINMLRDSLESFSEDSVLASKPVFNIYEDSKGNVWFCTLFNGVIKFDGKRFHQYLFTNELEHVNNFVSSVLEIAEDHYWVLNRTGLFEIKGKNKPKNIAMPNISMFHLFKDSRDNIWIASDSGAVKYNNRQFTYYTKRNGLVDDVIWKTMEDHEHNLWFISKDNGFSKLVSESFINYNVENGISSNIIYAINKIEEGNIWLGTDSGVVKFKNGKTAGQINFDLNKRLRIHNEVYDFKKLNDVIYIATNFGVAAISNNKVKEFLPKGEVRSLAKCWTIFPEDHNNIWLGTQGGICKLKDDSIVYWDFKGNITDHVFDIKKSSKGEIYFATESGLLIFDGKKIKQFRQKDGFTNQRVRCLVEDRLGVIWIATNEGIFTYSSNKFHKISIPLLKVDAIFSLAIDSKNNIWASLANEIIKIPNDGRRDKIVFLSRNEGFLGKECNNNSLYIDEFDNVWIGTKKGLTIFRPEYYREETVIPKLKISNIKLFHNDVDWSYYVDEFTDFGLPVNLELPYNQNHVTFVFKSVSLKKPESIVFRYQLKGYDNQWLYTKTPSVVYSSLKPGTYQFNVQVSVDGINWSNPPVVCEFSIAPPFYQTTWFYLLILSIVATWIYSYYRITRSNAKLNIQKDIIIKQRNEVESKNKAIMDSIRYAKRIQRAILPKKSVIEKELNNFFI